MCRLLHLNFGTSVFIYTYILDLLNIAGKNKKKVKSTSKKKAANTRPNAREITYYQGYATLCSGLFKVGVSFRSSRNKSCFNILFFLVDCWSEARVQDAPSRVDL